LKLLDWLPVCALSLLRVRPEKPPKARQDTDVSS
jgi:hypothetical protein